MFPRRFLYSLICLLLLFASTQKAMAAKSSGPFGAGIVLGSPTALTGKYWLSGTSAVDFGLAFGMRRYVLLYGDYLMHFPGLFGHRNQLHPYFGIGGIMLSGSGDPYYDDYDPYYGRWHERGSFWGLGVRVPFGLEWKPNPIGVFAEIAPGVSVIPATYSWFQAGIGIRYYF